MIEFLLYGDMMVCDIKKGIGLVEFFRFWCEMYCGGCENLLIE